MTVVLTEVIYQIISTAAVSLFESLSAQLKSNYQIKTLKDQSAETTRTVGVAYRL